MLPSTCPPYKATWYENGQALIFIGNDIRLTGSWSYARYLVPGLSNLHRGWNFRGNYNELFNTPEGKLVELWASNTLGLSFQQYVEIIEIEGVQIEWAD